MSLIFVYLFIFFEGGGGEGVELFTTNREILCILSFGNGLMGPKSALRSPKTCSLNDNDGLP